MLEKYPKSIKVAMIVTPLVGIFGILWGIFEVEEWPFFIFGLFTVIMLGLLFSSRFFLDHPAHKPIYIGFLIGIATPIILLTTLLLAASIGSTFNSGGSSDMAGLAGLFSIIILILFSIVTFFVSILIGLYISYKKSGNKIVLGIILIILLMFIGMVIFLIRTRGNIFGYF